jgi:xylulokinase
MYWLGIDVGTGGTRALLIDADGRPFRSHTAPHLPMRMEQPLCAEQDPDDWWGAAVRAVRGLLEASDVSGDLIGGIGLSGQMHGLVLLDADDRVIRPALIWCDQRSQTQVDWISETLGLENVVRWTANPPLTGFTLSKLLWVRDNEPEAAARIHHLLLPKDYVRFRLTGRFASDVSDASGTGLFDVAHRHWSREMIEGAEVDPDILPEVVESSDITGRLTQEASRATGLLAGIPVVGGAGDQAASAIGNGIVVPGVASCTLGTSGVVFVHTDRPIYDPAGRVHTFCHALEGAWHVMGVTQGAGLSLQWFRNTLAPESSYDELMAEASHARPGSDDLYWLPYLMGERTPHLDAAARGGWVGLTASHGLAELVRALVEGVSYSQKDCLDVIREMGIEVDTVRVSGGGARSPVWRQILADVFGKRVVVLQSEEGSAHGAALLALAGTSDGGSVAEVSARVVREAGASEPDPEIHARYLEGHARYRVLYPALRDFFRTLG